MNPDLIREMLAIINEMSQPVYLAARQKVLIYNWGGIIVFVPLLLASLVGTIVCWRKANAANDGFYAGLAAVICGIICLIFLSIVVVSIMSLLAFDYSVYRVIRVMLLGV